ncbi:MAG: anti-sigma factor family protein [Candidatus Polarisedimenticolia bacterium]
MTHEQLKAALPAYIVRRLEEGEMKRLDEHLEVCQECREMVASWRDWAGTMRETGQLLFEPHPEPIHVRLFAHGALEDEDAARVGLHLEVCASCELEATVWRSRVATASRPATVRPTPRGRVIKIAGLSAAAGLVAGLGLGWVLADFRSSSPVAWTGPTAQIVLPGMLRNGQHDPLTHTVHADEHRVIISFPSVDAGFKDRVGVYRFEIMGGEGAVLDLALTGETAARHVETASVVTFDVPAASLPPGRYQCRVTDPGGTVVYQIPIEIAGS